MDIELYLPAKPNSLIRKIWGFPLESYHNYQLLPDASVCLGFNLGSSLSGLTGELIENSYSSTQNFCILQGLNTKPIYAPTPSSSYLVVVEMHSLAMGALFGIPCSEVENKVIDGGMFLSDLNKVEDKLHSLNTFTEKAEWLEHYLYSQIIETSELHTAIKMNAVISKLHANLLQGKKADMQDYTGYTRMHTHRLATQWLGLSPKKYLRLQQFIKALHDLHLTQHKAVDIASSNGFFDQAHFNRIFRQFAGMTPKQYREQKTDFVGQLF